MEEEKEFETNTLKVGEIVLTASLPIKELCDLAVWLLQQKEIKSYLEVVEKKRKLGESYTG